MPFPKPVLWFSSNIVLFPLDVVRKHFLQPLRGLPAHMWLWEPPWSEVLSRDRLSFKISWENMELLM